MKRKTRRKIKDLLGILLAVLLVCGLVSLTSNLYKRYDNTKKEIHPTFEIGGLTNYGAYKKSTNTLYTKESFECSGLQVDLEFDNTIQYQVFFYDKDDKFLECTDILDSKFEDEIPLFTKTARIVLYPIIENPDDELKWYQTYIYPNQINIKVNKVQKYMFDETNDLFKENSKFGNWSYVDFEVRDESLFTVIPREDECLRIYSSFLNLNNIILFADNLEINGGEYILHCEIVLIDEDGYIQDVIEITKDEFTNYQDNNYYYIFNYENETNKGVIELTKYMLIRFNNTYCEPHIYQLNQ